MSNYVLCTLYSVHKIYFTQEQELGYNGFTIG